MTNRIPMGDRSARIGAVIVLALAVIVMLRVLSDLLATDLITSSYEEWCHTSDHDVLRAEGLECGRTDGVRAAATRTHTGDLPAIVVLVLLGAWTALTRRTISRIATMIVLAPYPLWGLMTLDHSLRLPRRLTAAAHGDFPNMVPTWYTVAGVATSVALIAMPVAVITWLGLASFRRAQTEKKAAEPAAAATE